MLCMTTYTLYTVYMYMNLLCTLFVFCIFSVCVFCMYEYTICILIRIFYKYFIHCLYVYRFPGGALDQRLNFLVTDLLTVVAFLIILNTMLPTIPYLTTIDKYTMFAFGYVLACAFCCVLFNYLDIENTIFEDWFFISAIIFLIIIHSYLIYHYYRCRTVEIYKTTIDRHEVRIMTHFINYIL